MDRLVELSYNTKSRYEGVMREDESLFYEGVSYTAFVVGYFGA